MILSEILSGINYQIIQGDLNKEIVNVGYDSRANLANGLFIAIAGFKTDGHNFILNAIQHASAIVVERDISGIPDYVTVIKVQNTRKALSAIAANFYCNPTAKIKLIAITGTNGKTSVSYILSSILQSMGYKVGIIGTNGVRINEKLLTHVNKTTPTTPESLDIQYIVDLMVRDGVQIVVMETSSMGLKLGRLDHCAIDVGVFTNLSHDHLDDHGTFEDYRMSKQILFSLADSAVINIDDDASDYFMQPEKHSITYGIFKGPELGALDIELFSDHSKFSVKFNDSVKAAFVPLPGQFNIYNTLAAIGACLSLGLHFEELIDKISMVKQIDGRVEAIKNDKDVRIMIDYAHTPKALENVLETLKAAGRKRLILVFGCGGNRDREKRSKMGQIGTSIADFSIITNDNPRHEPPEMIFEDICRGIVTENFKIVPDRREAIILAIQMAEKDDIILVAGKGSEQYQLVRDEKIPYSDKQTILDCLSF